MNDDKLVACLAKYSDSRETIQAVRKAIVGLAVAGRLDDRSASQFADTLGEFIGGSGHPSHTTEAKAKGLESKYETTDLPHPSLAPDRFVRLGDIAKIEKGKTGIKQARSGPYPLVVTASDRGSCDHYDFDGAAAIVPLVSSTGHGKASLHRLHYQEGKFALGSILAAAFPKSPERISARFLFEYLSAFKEELLVSQMIGTANVSLTVKKISEVPVPIVSRMAQRTVDELMALCDSLEAERDKREATRDRLTTTSLSRLTAPDVDGKQFKAHADFAIKVLPELTTRPDQIKSLRQTILDLAVRGKLVEQDMREPPAANFNELRADSFENLPINWLDVPLRRLLSEDTRNGYSRRPDDAENGIPILRISAGTVRRDGIVAEEEHKLISGIDNAMRDQFGLRSGDLLACRFNGNRAFVGRLTLFSDYLGLKPIYPDKLIRVRLDRRIVLPDFIRMAGESGSVRSAIEQFCTTTVGNWGISATNLKEVRFPVPPLAEQHRIVAKVNQLNGICDRFEHLLNLGQDTKLRLLEELLFEALEPVVMEAA